MFLGLRRHCGAVRLRGRGAVGTALRRVGHAPRCRGRLITVVTLGCAILLGGYWAYVTLGWGGYWGWDPVENSSLVPWIAIGRPGARDAPPAARGRFRKLNFALAILAYVLVVYATFLTRSGVLADFSVHSFVDLGITGSLVADLAVFLLIGFGALAWRFREIPTRPGDEPFLSRPARAIGVSRCGCFTKTASPSWWPTTERSSLAIRW